MSIAGRMRKRIMCIKMFENFAVSGEEIRFSGLISECVHSLKKIAPGYRNVIILVKLVRIINLFSTIFPLNLNSYL